MRKEKGKSNSAPRVGLAGLKRMYMIAVVVEGWDSR